MAQEQASRPAPWRHMATPHRDAMAEAAEVFGAAYERRLRQDLERLLHREVIILILILIIIILILILVLILVLIIILILVLKLTTELTLILMIQLSTSQMVASLNIRVQQLEQDHRAMRGWFDRLWGQVTELANWIRIIWRLGTAEGQVALVGPTFNTN